MSPSFSLRTSGVPPCCLLGVHAEDVGKNLGHRRIKLFWNSLSDLDGAIQALREWRVLDNRNAVPASDFLDLLCEQVLSLGDHGGSCHVIAILQCHRKMCWVGDYDRGGLGGLNHAVAARLTLQAADASLGRGIAIHLLRLFTDVFLTHAKIALKLLAHCDVVDYRPRQQNE